MIIKYYLYGKLSNQSNDFRYENTSTPRQYNFFKWYGKIQLSCEILLES